MTGILIIVAVTLPYNFASTMSSLLLLRLLKGIGYYGTSNTVAQAIGPLVGLHIIQSSYPVLFYLLAAMSLASIAGSVFVHYKRLPAEWSVRAPGLGRSTLWNRLP